VAALMTQQGISTKGEKMHFWDHLPVR